MTRCTVVDLNHAVHYIHFVVKILMNKKRRKRLFIVFKIFQILSILNRKHLVLKLKGKKKCSVIVSSHSVRKNFCKMKRSVFSHLDKNKKQKRKKHQME